MSGEGDAQLAVDCRGTVGQLAVDVSFAVPLHGVAALFGPSGCGKTTVLRFVAGLLRLDGRVKVGTHTWQDGATFAPPHRRAVGYVFQEASLFPHLSVLANLRYGLRRALKGGVRQEIDEADVVSFLRLGPLLDRSPSNLSGGERQRVAVGRALLAQPRIMLMDEPLAALDQRSKEDILPYLESLHTRLSIPVLYVSHDLAEVQRLADTLVLLEQGRVVGAGPLAEVLTNLDLPSAQRPDASVVLDAEVGDFDSRYTLTTLRCPGADLLVPGRLGAPGSRQRIRVAAADVSLSVREPSLTTITNVLPARIVEVRPLNEAQVTVVLELGSAGEGARLLARVTRRSFDLLGLGQAERVFAQVKAVSIVR